MKNKIFKLLSVVMALAMVFTMFTCVVSAEEATQDVIVDGVISPALASGTVQGNPGMMIENAVADHAFRLYTVNTYEVATIDSVIIGEGCRVYVQFWNADGSYNTGSGWQYAGTYKIASVAKYLKITFDSADGQSTPPVDGLKLVQKSAVEPEVPTEPETPVQPETPVLPGDFEFTPSEGDTYAEGVVSPLLASGTVNGNPGMSIDNAVVDHAVRLYTVNTYNAIDYESVIVGEGCRVYVQFWDQDGFYTAGSGWKFAGTYKISDLGGYAGAKYFKITFDSADGTTTPPVDGLKLVVNTSPEEPETPVEPEEPEVPDTGVKVNPTMTQGTIDKGVVNAAVGTRVHTADFIYVSDIQSVSIAKDYKAGYHFYDENGVWVNGHIGGWQIGRKTGAELAEMVPGATYVKIVLGKKTDAELYPEALTQDSIVISLVDGLNEFTKPDLPEVEPELPPLAEDPNVMINFNDYINDRGNGLANTFAKLNNGEKINVLYMGGSVTNGTGASERELTSWRGIIGNWLAHNAGKGKVNNVNAAYGDTCSLFGAYRLNAEILPEEPDLIFVEFGINDMYNSGKRGYNLKDSTAQFETIIRNLRKALPDCDIVTVLITERGTLNPNGLQAYAQAHENICIAYNVPSIHAGRALAKEIALTGKAWSDYSGDSAHPNDLGYSIYAGPIKAYLDAELKANGENTAVINHKLPAMVSDKLLDGDIGFIDADAELIKASEALGGTGFAYGSGATNLANSGTDVFKGGVFSKNEADELVVKFTGTELAMIEYQPITGFKVSVDDGEYVTIKRDTVRPIVLATNLEYGEHIVRIKPVFSSQSSSFHVQGFFTRNQNNATLKENEIPEPDCESGVHIYGDNGFCTVCGIYEILDPTLVKSEDGVWYYYENGVKTNATTLVKYAGKWFYVEDGTWIVRTTLVKYKDKWFYVKGGKWNSSTEDLVKYSGKWFYIKNGKWSSSSKTLFKKNGSWFYINKGKWDSSAKCIFKYNGKDFFINKGKWNSSTNTLFKKDGKYYAIKSGKWTKSKTIIKYNGKKYYVNKGYAQTKFSGKVTISGKKYTVKKGIIK